MTLKNKTLFITGASRGIGLAIALRAGRDGANIVVAAKTVEAHRHLPGTIHSAAEQIRALGGQALALAVDVRDDHAVAAAVDESAKTFGGIDIVVNNASAISLTSVEQTEMKRWDLMHSVNVRGTYLVSKCCIPYLRRAENPHVLTISPPLDMAPRWFAGQAAYAISKFGMSQCMLGMAEEFKQSGIAFNALWPRSMVATAAIEFAIGDHEAMRACRRPEIMADAAYLIFSRRARECSGNFFIDDTLLHEAGERDFEKYSVDPSVMLRQDLFVPDSSPPPPGVSLVSSS